MSKRQEQEGASSEVILIAEDNPVNMLLIRSILENILPQARIVEAENGHQAVEKFAEASPDLVFMDIRMPQKNGYEAATDIRKIETSARAPIIALTAGTAKGEREKCLEAGMDDYISKPIVQESIERVLQKWMIKKVPAGRSGWIGSMAGQSASHYDPAELSHRLGNNEAVQLKLLAVARESLDNCLIDLRKHHRALDFSALAETAHKLKGVALSACFAQLARLAERLEVVSPGNSGAVNDLLKEVDHEVNQVKSLIS